MLRVPCSDNCPTYSIPICPPLHTLTPAPRPFSDCRHAALCEVVSSLPPQQQLVLLSLPAMLQEHVLQEPPSGGTGGTGWGWGWLHCAGLRLLLTHRSQDRPMGRRNSEDPPVRVCATATSLSNISTAWFQYVVTISAVRSATSSSADHPYPYLPFVATPHPAEPPSPPAALRPRLLDLAARLCRVEQFYDSVGGLLGYQLKSLELIVAGMQVGRVGVG